MSYGMSDGGKGSKPRPFNISDDEYAENMNRIFGDKSEERERKAKEKAEKEIKKAGGVVTENTRKAREKLKATQDEANKLLGVKKEEQTVEEDEEAKKEKVRFNEQAFLMLNIEDYVSMSADQCKRFRYFGQIMHDDPSQINNILFKKKMARF